MKLGIKLRSAICCEDVTFKSDVRAEVVTTTMRITMKVNNYLLLNRNVTELW